MTRFLSAWRELTPEQRRVVLASFGLFVSMFLPWYDKTDTVIVHGAAKATQTSLSAFQAFSFVEAAVLLVSAGVLTMLFARAEGRAFQLPGGDGVIVMLAGGWTALLIFYRLLDKPGLQGNERVTSTVGVEWGIFIALLLALAVLYTGARMRANERPEPPLRRGRGSRPPPPVDPDVTVIAAERVRPRSASPVQAREARVAPAPPATADKAPTPATARGRSRYPPAPPEQLSFEDPPARRRSE
jgi:hypothetical protein